MTKIDRTYLGVIFCKILVISQVHKTMSQAVVWETKVHYSQGVVYFGQHLFGGKYIASPTVLNKSHIKSLNLRITNKLSTILILRL